MELMVSKEALPVFSKYKVLVFSLISVLAQGVWADDLSSSSDYSGGGFYGAAFAVNADGSVLVGVDGNGNAFRWTQGGNVQKLDDGVFSSSAYGVSSNGSVVVGASGVGGGQAFRWSESAGMVGLGHLTGGTYSEARGVNADGSVVVGFSNTSAAGVNNRAFRWSESTGNMVDLGTLSGAGFSQAFGVSDDGSVVVGNSSSGTNSQAFRWTESSGSMVGLGILGGGDFSVAYGVSGDGSVVVGQSDSTEGEQAFRWSEGAGMVGLGDLSGGFFFSSAQGVNIDGSVIVGFSTSTKGEEAFRWVDGTGIQLVTTWLSDNGVSVDGGITLQSATGVSDDGNTIVGYGEFGNGFDEVYIARVGGSGSGAGVITINELGATLSSSSVAVSSALRTSNTMVNGAHSRPLSRRVAVGESAFWTAGDWGRDNHDDSDGEFGLAEVGIAHNLGVTQLNLALGKTWANHNLADRGEIDSRGSYAMLEAIVPLTAVDGLYAVMSGFYHEGEANIDRGYVNAGVYDESSASPDVNTWGARARLEWESAIAIQTAQFSPYADVTYTRTKMDSYTETGGGFPTRFDSREDGVTELRLGFNGALPLAAISATFITNLEAAHRFDNEGAGASGEVIGLNAFDLEGQKFDTSWVKAGLGIEGNVGPGKAYLMLNGTTEGEAPSAWLAMSYQLGF